MSCAGKTVTIDGVTYELTVPGAKQSASVVLVRTTGAGVHVGELVSKEGNSVTLKNAHRVWRWKGANTLNELSQKGGDTGYTRISEAVPTITVEGVHEVITCSEAAAVNLRTPRWP